MSSGLNFHLYPNEYQRIAISFLTEEAVKDPLLCGLIGLNGESGEAIDILKKHLFKGHELDKEKLALELGDIAWYLVLTSNAIGYDFESILKMNIEKLKARYPEGKFSMENSINGTMKEEK